MITVQLVPMAVEDKRTLEDALQLLRALWTLDGRDDWVGAETIAGLQRIRSRLSDYSHPFTIPLPTERRSGGKPLFVQPEEERE